MRVRYFIYLVVVLAAGGAFYKALSQRSVSASSSAVPDPANAENAATQRIIAIDGALTEIVYALGFGDHVVAADATARWPAAVKKKPSIGYVRQLSAEGILSLSPTLVLSNADAGPPEVIRQLNAAGLNIYNVPGGKMARSFPVILERIRTVGVALGVAEKGHALASDVQADLDAVRTAVAARTGPKALFLFNPTSEKVTAGGRGTGADEFMTLVGLVNVAGNLDGWKPLTQESIVAAAPEIIIATSNKDTHNPFSTTDELLTINGLALTPAGKFKRVIFVDSSKFLIGGPRSGEMAIEFARVIYPDLSLPAPKSSRWFQEVEKLHHE